jgi:hypothetical protein
MDCTETWNFSLPKKLRFKINQTFCNQPSSFCSRYPNMCNRTKRIGFRVQYTCCSRLPYRGALCTFSRKWLSSTPFLPTTSRLLLLKPNNDHLLQCVQHMRTVLANIFQIMGRHLVFLNRTNRFVPIQIWHRTNGFVRSYQVLCKSLAVNEMVQGPCAHLQLHETLTVVLYRVNVIIDRLKFLLVQVAVMLLGLIHNCQNFH